MRGSTRIEIAWLVVPTLLVLWITGQNSNIYNQLNILGLKQIVHLPLEAPANAATDGDRPAPAVETITVISSQWEWSFRYPNQATSHELHLPVNQSTRLDLQSEDVIHGFYVPEFRLKQDIVPHRDIDLVLTPNRVGHYRLKDSQFSGADFALMIADVYVESSANYEQWLRAIAEQSEPATPSEPARPVQNPLFTTPLIKTGWYAGSPHHPAVTDRTFRLTGDS